MFYENRLTVPEKYSTLFFCSEDYPNFSLSTSASSSDFRVESLANVLCIYNGISPFLVFWQLDEKLELKFFLSCFNFFEGSRLGGIG